MKTLFTFSILLIPFIIFSQHGYSPFYCNGVKSFATNSGILFYPQQKEEGAMIVNPTSDSEKPVSTIYNSSINISGKVNGEIVGLLRLYDYSSSNSISGPMSIGNAKDIRYDKFWKIRQWEIIELIKDFNDNNKIDGVLSNNILTWPGKGNPFSFQLEGLKWDDKEYAPFFDRSNDGIYNPYDGDYPNIDQSCALKIPSEIIWSLYHTFYQNETSPYPKMEVQTLLYGFETTKSVLLNSTIYSRISIICYNEKFDEVRLGLFNDLDLGCPDDDLLGTSIEQNAIYVYNKNDLDRSPCSIGGIKKNTFSGKVPTQSIICLNKPLSGSMICFRESSNSGMLDPASNIELNNLLNNKWKDGKPLQIGGNGYDVGGMTTNYAFSDSPNISDGWHMDHLIGGLDPRIFMNFDLGTMTKNDRQEFDFAYTFHPADQNLSRHDNVDKMIVDIDTVQDFYNNCFNSSENYVLCQTDCVWPGDVDNNGIINNLDILPIGAAIGISGNSRAKMFDAWQPINSNNWDSSTPNGLNYKYIDCNGSGLINESDFEAVKNNMLASNNNYSTWGGYNSSGNDLTFNKITFGDSFKGGDEFTMDIILGKESEIDLYGLGYSISYDTTYLNMEYSTINADWLTDSISKFSIINKLKGKIHVGLVKTKGDNTGYINKKIGRIQFKVRSDFNANTLTTIKFENYQKIDVTGNITEITSTPLIINVNNTLTTHYTETPQFQIFPNPAKNEVIIKSDFVIKRIQLYDNFGRKLNANLFGNTMNTGNLFDGFYYIKLTDINGHSYIEKLIINH